MKTYYEPFTVTLAGFIVPMISGLISSTSSSLILYVILKSSIKLSSTYHRIMAMMSCFDIISSIFIALGTIMMPSDTMYPFAGPMLGNKVTCQIQGVMVAFGLFGALSSNVFLSSYFLLSITFKMDLKKIARYLEPIMYTSFLLLLIFCPLFFLSKDMIHPTLGENFCFISLYPKSCDEIRWYDWDECDWGDNTEAEHLIHVLRSAAITITIIFAYICVAIVIILWTVFRKNLRISHLISMIERERDQEMPYDDEYHATMRELSDTKYSRILIVQAFMYIAALLSTWTINFANEFLDISSFELDALNSVLFPLQGLWNLIIFLTDKTYLIRRSQPDIETFWQAVIRIFASPFDTPAVAISNLSNIHVLESFPSPINKIDSILDSVQGSLTPSAICSYPSNHVSNTDMSYNVSFGYGLNVSHDLGSDDVVSSVIGSSDMNSKDNRDEKKLKRKYYNIFN